MIPFSIVLFDNFETLDAFGPAEVIGCLPGLYRLGFYSQKGGTLTSSQSVRTETMPFTDIPQNGVLLIPGGGGTRALVEDSAWIHQLSHIANAARQVLTVCTGAALLAKTGLLDGKRATTNKRAFAWVCSLNQNVLWQSSARWTVDGKYYSSSGVSAGIDMSLGFVEDFHGAAAADEICAQIEYVRNRDRDNDPFQVEWVAPHAAQP